MAQQQDVTTGRGVAPEWLDGFIKRWEAAWDSHEPDRVLALMTEDIVYEDSAWPRTMRGHADVREFLEHVWRGMPDTHFEWLEGPFLHPSEPKAAFYWRGTGTHTGPVDPPGLKATGKSVEFYGADFHEYRDEKVARLKIVFDMADVMRQLGALPAEGGREEKMLIGMTNLRGKLPSRS
jgi:steroid delta-isomerase-like uncharacterized protein